ncbi:SusC/RagA family TonB-linked outer membrane protein [Chitinophaga sp. SYP-B3965]|uniref:SusC/RagA family TonB-linked outer membrane protein n=1 Tax=Chitinophaga sp. SYP-B3965 TaxID=2663120 RepID=UPI001299B728|nr:TonB-dependent receptor [Chitinophaga sp. SYP-B3965]MRG48882.1 SusC/RagA family TonB-linked outer membrane protein [Chitinophaga sp. SYP-B3965]
MKQKTSVLACVSYARKWLLPFSLFLLFQLCNVVVTFAQAAKVEGTVKDQTGNSLPGVTVMVKGTKKGVATSELGRFSIQAEKTDVLVFSFTGFTTKEETVGPRTTIDVTLLENISTLNDVVVVGYGTQKKRDITGAISSIGAKTIEEKQPVSIFDAIQGAAPGVRVMSNSGAPGEDQDITIRGLSTLSDGGVRPLYIVDGVTMDNINAINPKDIQSIEILKDAASAAIYGSRSANGVIIITTKRGDDGKPKIDVGFLRTYNKLSNRIPQANRLERQMFERRGNIGLDPKPDDSTSFAKNADNDYQDLITQTGIRNQVDIGISGGTKALSFYSSLQYLDEKGIILNSYAKRFTLRNNLDYRPSKYVTMSTRINFSYQDRNNINEGNVIRQALQRPPGMALYLPDGSFIYNNGGRRNPIAEAYLRKDISKVYKGVLYQSFDFQLAKPLKLHADVSADVELTRRSTFNSKLLDTNTPQVSSGSDNTALPIRTQGNVYASYQQKIKEHSITAMAGFNFEKNNQEEVNLAGRLYVTESVETLNAAGSLTLTDIYSNGTINSLAGFYGRLAYDYKGKYLFNATVRRDGSSRFGSDTRWGNFPSVSVGWRFSDEPWLGLQKNSILTDGKIRASWGLTGNQAIGNFDAVQQFVFGSYYYNNVSGVRTNDRLGNSLLKWEETAQSDIGIDLTFLNGRIVFVADYYVKNTSDLLYDAPLPLEAGYPGKARTNTGSIQNKGIELSIVMTPVSTKHFNWTTSLNYSQIRNKITRLPGGDYVDGIWYVGEGREAGNFYGYEYQGIYQYDQSNAWTEDYRTRLIPQFQKDSYGNVIIQKNMQPILTGYQTPDGKTYAGDVKQLTTNGVVSKGGDVIWENLPDSKGELNGNIGNEDRKIIGFGQPRWSLGWNNTFSYKRFSLSFSVYGNFGNSIYNENKRNLASFSNSNTTPEPHFIRNMWKYPGQITDSYLGGDKTADNFRRGNSQFLEDGSFVRLQTARLTYSVPDYLLRRAHIQQTSVFVYGNGLLTWTDYSGFDPEVSQRSVLKPGEDPGKFPRKREVGIGINVTL